MGRRILWWADVPERQRLTPEMIAVRWPDEVAVRVGRLIRPEAPETCEVALEVLEIARGVYRRCGNRLREGQTACGLHPLARGDGRPKLDDWPNPWDGVIPAISPAEQDRRSRDAMWERYRREQAEQRAQEQRRRAERAAARAAAPPMPPRPPRPKPAPAAVTVLRGPRLSFDEGAWYMLLVLRRILAGLAFQNPTLPIGLK
jgi:hypothetical protein